MSIFIGLLTVVVVLNSVLLILLVLVQLPKKEAGAGMAFGGAATDALFGAGSGNVLTKVTKYGVAIFIGLTVLLAALQSGYYHKTSDAFAKAVGQQAGKPAPAIPSTPANTPTPAAETPAATPIVTNFLTSTTAGATNAPAVVSTNAPQK